MLYIWLSILVQTETNIVLISLHYLVRASNDSGLFCTIFLFHEWKNSVVDTQTRWNRYQNVLFMDINMTFITSLTFSPCTYDIRDVDKYTNKLFSTEN